MKDRLLLHVCCAPCAVHPLTLLRERFSITLFFYGPNIHPAEEYGRRLNSAKQISEILKLELVEAEYNPPEWYDRVKGLEKEREGGERCKVCYRLRLERTAIYAKQRGYGYFGATLTLSPHKPAGVINPIGESLAKEHGLAFLSEDFKKNDGFKKSCELSKEYNLYRQKYCGCEYSNRNDK